MANIKTEVVTDDSQHSAAVKRMERDIVSLQEKLRRLTEQQKKAADEGKRADEEAAKAGEDHNAMLGEGIGLVKNVVAGYLSMQGAIKLVTAALEHKLEVERKAAGATIAEAPATAKLLRNIPNADAPQILASIRAISAETGVGVPGLKEAMAEAASAKGALSLKDALSSVRTAARVAPDDQGEMQAIAGGLLDAASLTGTGDAEQNLGFLLAAQSNARSTNLKQIAQRLVPAAISVRQAGDSAGDAMALGAAMTNALKDPDAGITKTAMIQLAAQLEKALPKQGSTAERIEFLQQNQSKAKNFLKNASFEASAMTAIRPLLTDANSEVSRNFQQIRKSMPGPELAKALAREKIGLIQGDDSIKLMVEQKGDAAATDRMLVDNKVAAQTHVGAEGLEKLRATMSWGEWLTDFSGSEYWMNTAIGGMSPQQAKVEAMQKMAMRSRDNPARAKEIETMIDAMGAFPKFFIDRELGLEMERQSPLEQAKTRFREGYAPAAGDLELLKDVLPDAAEPAFQRREAGDIRPEDNRLLREIARTLEGIRREQATRDGQRKPANADLDRHVTE